ncbi:MAG: hypothetical protein LBC84_00770, partial [Prevotellaceae bacterium]|nr:hypothetical protein [Prevotellaceae bacterium]
MIKQEINELSNFEWTCLLGAIRYFCNRKTITSATFPDSVISNCYRRLSLSQKQFIVRELKDIEVFGDPNIDNKYWQKFRSALNEGSHKEVELIDGSKIIIFEALGVLYPLKEYLQNPHRETFIQKKNIK